MNQSDSVYNHHGLLINNIDLTIVSRIKIVVFSIDYLNLSILLKGSAKQFLEDLETFIPRIATKKERYCSNPIFSDLFENRTYFKLSPTTDIWVITNKVTPLKGFDGILRAPHVTPNDIHKLEAIINKSKQIRDYWISKFEPTFDFIGEDSGNPDWIQALLKQTLFLSHGRDAFEKGEDETTNYINFRTSGKQTRMYQKDITDEDTETRSLRFEIPIKTRKLFSEDILTPSDILKYEMNILDEVGFYRVNETKLKRSLLDYDTQHFFSELIADFVNNRGFHAAQLYARRMKECPANCKFRLGETCLLKPKVIKPETRDDRFRAIQKCTHAKTIKNFRKRYCDTVPEMEPLKARMHDAFNTWKDRK